MQPSPDPLSPPRTPRVSVVIPTYNRAAVLPAAIESVLHQSFRDFEIVVIDDGSTDDTSTRLEPYRERIRYLYQANQGVSAARNAGIRHSSGEWIAFLDSDDIWLPTKLEAQMQALEKFGPDFGACFSDANLIADSKGKLSAFARAGFFCLDDHAVLGVPLPWIIANTPAVYIPTLVVRRSVIENCRAFDTRLLVAEDTDLLFRLCLQTKLCFVNRPLAELDIRPRREGSLFAIFLGMGYPVFRCRVHMLDNWLRILPSEVDHKIHHSIRTKLQNTYYDWLATTLRKLSFSDSLNVMQRIRCFGDSYPRICVTIMSRAFRKAVPAGPVNTRIMQMSVALYTSFTTYLSLAGDQAGFPFLTEFINN